MRFLVTGGAGFIGSHIVENLLQQKHNVRVLDDFSTGKSENLAFAKSSQNMEVIEGDIRQPAVVAQAGPLRKRLRSILMVAAAERWPASSTAYTSIARKAFASVERPVNNA